MGGYFDDYDSCRRARRRLEDSGEEDDELDIDSRRRCACFAVLCSSCEAIFLDLETFRLRRFAFRADTEDAKAGFLVQGRPGF